MKVLVAGDFCPRDRILKFIKNRDYSFFSPEIINLIKEADYSVVNFESPVVERDAVPINKLGPNLYCSSYAVDAIKYAGFNAVTLANNHIYDFGEEGVLQTLSALESYQIEYVGAGANIIDASNILYKEVNGSRLAIINCCEHEFSIATELSGGANPLNVVWQYYAIQEAKKLADYILVIVHGGHEHFQLPSPRMVDSYRFFIDAGADAVVNHHQHCFSGYETYKGKPIFYGIGNFCFDNPNCRNSIWNEGYMVCLDFTKQGVKFQLYPYRQCDKEPSIILLPLQAYSTKLTDLNSVIADGSLLNEKINQYYADSMPYIRSVFNPIQNRYIAGAQNRKWIPYFFLTNKWLIKMRNYVLCEAHRDKVKYFLEHSTK